MRVHIVANMKMTYAIRAMSLTSLSHIGVFCMFGQEPCLSCGRSREGCAARNSTNELAQRLILAKMAAATVMAAKVAARTAVAAKRALAVAKAASAAMSCYPAGAVGPGMGRDTCTRIVGTCAWPLVASHFLLSGQRRRGTARFRRARARRSSLARKGHREDARAEVLDDLRVSIGRVWGRCARRGVRTGDRPDLIPGHERSRL